jgi:hypothetical protein
MRNSVVSIVEVVLLGILIACGNTDEEAPATKAARE